MFNHNFTVHCGNTFPRTERRNQLKDAETSIIYKGVKSNGHTTRFMLINTSGCLALIKNKQTNFIRDICLLSINLKNIKEFHYN